VHVNPKFKSAYFIYLLIINYIHVSIYSFSFVIIYMCVFLFYIVFTTHMHFLPVLYIYIYIYIYMSDDGPKNGPKLGTLQICVCITELLKIHLLLNILMSWLLSLLVKFGYHVAGDAVGFSSM
jgi:hypothetical protein